MKGSAEQIITQAVNELRDALWDLDYGEVGFTVIVHGGSIRRVEHHRMVKRVPDTTNPTARPVYTVSVDEKPGVQALATSAPDLPPVPGEHAAIGRDHDYVRHGTVSILAGVDLHDGHIIAQIHDRHRSFEFVKLLKEIDAHYPPESVIRVILDNHSSHISRETMKYLATRPGRFVYIHTPKHGSWLNLIEAVFRKWRVRFFARSGWHRGPS